MVIVTAGTSDLPVAEEARVTAEGWNCDVSLVADVGVAGLHRLLHQLHRLDHADVLVVVAGMEGALPSVVGGLVDCPVIAVPTSIGYGAHFQGLAALLGMLNSCASNVVVVNIDAGFNGGHVAGLIARRAGLARLGSAGARAETPAGSGGSGSSHNPRPEEPGTRRLGGLGMRTRSVPDHVARTRSSLLPALPPRPTDSHKGRFGTVLVIAGSRGMAGAAALCGASVLRSGAGLVRIATPAEVQPTVASFEPSYMTYPLPDDGQGMIRFEPSIPVLKRLIEPADVVAIGPGLGQSEDIRNLVHWLITETDRPLVIDADGLNMLAGMVELVAGLTRPVVLTPHPGEFARLAGCSVADRASRPDRPVPSALARRSRDRSSSSCSRGRGPSSRMAAGSM